MKLALRRFLISALFGALVIIAPTPSFAERANVFSKIFDVVILRPLGTIKLVVGITALVPAAFFYTLKLPFDPDMSEFGEVAEILVVEPANYVFRRPIGADLEGQ